MRLFPKRVPACSQRPRLALLCLVVWVFVREFANHQESIAPRGLEEYLCGSGPRGNQVSSVWPQALTGKQVFRAERKWFRLLESRREPPQPFGPAGKLNECVE